MWRKRYSLGTTSPSSSTSSPHCSSLPALLLPARSAPPCQHCFSLLTLLLPARIVSPCQQCFSLPACASRWCHAVRRSGSKLFRWCSIGFRGAATSSTLQPPRLLRSGNLFHTDSPPQRPGQQHIPDGSPLQRPGQQQTSSGGEKDSGLASNLAHLGRIC